MKCPRCVQRIHRAAESCPQCGFVIADADQRFGAEEVSLHTLTDGAGVFRQRERETVEAAMGRFCQRFPQLFVAVYTGSLGEVTNMRQFGFWLLNRAAFRDVSIEKPNEAGILITIDPESKSAGIAYGYLLDPFLDERDTFDCLCRGHAHLLEGRYAVGVNRILRRLEEILAKRSRQAQRDPHRFERKVSPPPQVGDLVKRIRSGHQLPKESPQPSSKRS